MRMKPSESGSVKTERLELSEEVRMVHCIESFGDIEKEDTNILLLVKYSVPSIGTAKEKCLL
jgi:hypothetical protein